MADPRDGDVAAGELGKHRALVSPRAFGEESLPHHFVEERPRIEVVGRREFLERTWQAPLGAGWLRRVMWLFCHA